MKTPEKKRKKVKENIAVYDKIIKLEENIYIAEFESVKNIEKDFIEYFNKIQ